MTSSVEDIIAIAEPVAESAAAKTAERFFERMERQAQEVSRIRVGVVAVGGRVQAVEQRMCSLESNVSNLPTEMRSSIMPAIGGAILECRNNRDHARQGEEEKSWLASEKSRAFRMKVVGLFLAGSAVLSPLIMWLWP